MTNPPEESCCRVVSADGYRIRTERATSDASLWLWGTVRTPLGYVNVYAEMGHVSLSIIQGGYEVTRVYRDKTITKRGLVTLARRFIEEMQ